MKTIRTALLALTALALLPAAAEAGRITYTNSSATVVRIKWKVADSESGWTKLAIGQSVFRDFPDDYPPIELSTEIHTGVNWGKGCWWRSNAYQNTNLKTTGTLFDIGCERN